MPLTFTTTVAEGLRHQARGDLTAAAASYRQAHHENPQDADALLLLGILARQSKHHAEAIQFIAQATSLRPQAPHLHLNLGLAFFAAGKWDQAAASFLTALILDPTRAAAHHNLGAALAKRADPARAEICFRKAIALEPQCAEYHNSLGGVLLYRRPPAEAEQAFREAIRLQPTYAPAQVNLGTAFKLQGRLSETRIQYEAGLALDPTLDGAHYNLSLVNLREGRLLEGWRGHEHRWDFEELRMARRGFPQPQWQGPSRDQPIAGKTILLHAEQGFGDTLQFLRYVPLVAALGATVILEVQRPLHRLAAAQPGPAIVLAKGDPLPPFDLHCPLMSLPFAFATDLHTIPARTPYLTVPTEAITEARNRLITVVSLPSTKSSDLDRSQTASSFGAAEKPLYFVPGAEHSEPRYPSRPLYFVPGAEHSEPRYPSRPLYFVPGAEHCARPNLRIGIAWSGNPKFRTDTERSIPLKTLLPLTEIPGLTLISLQKGPASEQLHTTNITDAAPTLADFHDTAALIATLDLVLSVDTAVAHLAGALGIPVWIMLPHTADWRWLERRNDSPWYPTARLFRQPAPGDWTAVIHHVALALAAARDLLEKESVGRDPSRRPTQSQSVASV